MKHCSCGRTISVNKNKCLECLIEQIKIAFEEAGEEIEDDDLERFVRDVAGV